VVNNFKERANFIWGIADLLRGDYKRSEYGRVILPLTVLRRLDCVLEPTKETVLAYLPQIKKLSPEATETVLKKKAKLSFYNKSKFDFKKLAADPNDIASNLRNYINGFSKNARNIPEHFNFNDHIDRLDKANLLYKIIIRFAEMDLHPDNVSNIEMGYIFEELIRRFAELSNETAGEHFTPREVIRLIVNLLFLNDKNILTKKGIVKTLYDPACGTGGMLSIAEEYLRELNPDADLRVFGQELNPESFAICNSDMLIKGQNPDQIKYDNSFTKDGFKNEKFDYMLSNPPFGVEWKKIEDVEFYRKMTRSLGNKRNEIGEEDIVKITKIYGEFKDGEYCKIFPNEYFGYTRVTVERPLRLNFQTSKERIARIEQQHGFINLAKSKKKGKEGLNEIEEGKKLQKQVEEMLLSMDAGIIYKNRQRFIEAIEQKANDIGINLKAPVTKAILNALSERDETADICMDEDNKPEPDTDLRDYENVPLMGNIDEYFKREVLPHVPDAWMDRSKDKVGYEINFTKEFYKYKPLRSIEEIRKDILALEKETEGLLQEILK